MRQKGGINKKWTQEEKLRIVRIYYEERISQFELAKREGIAKGHLWTWIHIYQTQGEAGLRNRRKPGNKYSALHTSKKLNETERLRLELMKAEVEIERLKKGYQVKGVGVDKEYVTLNAVNTK